MLSIRKYLTSRIFLIGALLGTCLLCVSAYGGAVEKIDAEDVFYKACKYYDSGDYEKAISGFESILKTGKGSASLYYDLGNCYLKYGRTGRAILNYRRAMYFIPRDGALQANYRYAVSLMKQRDPAPRTHPLLQSLERIFDRLTVGESLFLFGTVYYAFAAAFILSIFYRRYRLWAGLVVMILFCATLIFIIPIISKTADLEHDAVVVSQIADSRIAPLDDGASSFPMYEGMRAYILKKVFETGSWCKIKRLDGKIGWVKSSDIEMVAR